MEKRLNSEDAERAKAALKTYWQRQAQLWWEKTGRVEAFCDVCLGRVTPETSFYFPVGDRLKCLACTEESLQRWAESGMPADYFGPGEVEQALAATLPAAEAARETHPAAKTEYNLPAAAPTLAAGGAPRLPIWAETRSSQAKGGFYFWSYIVGMGLALALLTAAWATSPDQEGTPLPDLFGIASLPSLYVGVTCLILLWRAWKAIQWEGCRTRPGTDRGMRITPGKAVGFLFIPLWNLVWWVHALVGWARNYNAYVSRFRPELPQAPEKLFWLYTVFAYAGTAVVITLMSKNSTSLLPLGVCFSTAAFPVAAAAIREMEQAVFRLGKAAAGEAPAAAGPLAACPRCAAALPPSAAFCPSCGAPTAALCAGCGTELPTGARFCPACGREAGPAAPRAEPSREPTVRRVEVSAYGLGDGSPLLLEENPDLDRLLAELPVIQKPSEANRRFWAEASPKLRRTAVLIGYLQHSDPTVRRRTLQLLTEEDYTARVSQAVLDRLAADPEEEVRKEAARTVWRHEGRFACGYAVEKLKDEIRYGTERSPVGPVRGRQALALLAETAPDAAARAALEEQAKEVL